MNINKYTEKAREAVAAAVELAQSGNNPQVEPEHLLVALVDQKEGIVPGLLRKLNLDPAQGLLISSIAEGGPAEKAGWLIGDIMLELGEHKVSDLDTLQAALGADRVGKELRASVARGGVLVESAVTIGERPRRHC